MSDWFINYGPIILFIEIQVSIILGIIYGIQVWRKL